MEKLKRLMVLVKPAQKRSIVSRARARRLSMGEMVRRSVEAYQSDEDAALLARLVKELEASSREAMRALREAEAEVKKTLAHFAARRRYTLAQLEKEQRLLERVTAGRLADKAWLNDAARGRERL